MSFISKANQPMNIGSLTLSNRLIQAPLAGISCAPFRELFSLFAKPAYAVTEMISAHSMLQHERLNKRYLARSSKEGKWAIQLSGHEPDLLANAVRIAETYHPDLIDLNCGCPKPKIRGKGCGSALMDSPKELEAVVTAMRQATHLPLTVKIRTAGNTLENQYLEAAKIIEACGADAIIVHGRHHTEGYDVSANYAQIRLVKECVSIPVIANGDVSDLASMQRCFDESQAAGIMIARGTLGKPWLFQQLLEGGLTPAFEQRVALFQQHLTELSILEGADKVALMQGRRLLKWYFPELDSECLSDLYEIETLGAFISSLKNRV